MSMMTGKYNNMSDNEFLDSLDQELVERISALVKKNYIPKAQHEALMTQFRKLTSTNNSLVVKLKQQIARGNVYREAVIVSEKTCSTKRAEMQRAKALAVSSGRFVKVGE